MKHADESYDNFQSCFFLVRFVLLIVICAVLFGAATYRNYTWLTVVDLWQDTVAKSPRKSRPLNSLGTAYAALGRYDAAIDCFKSAIEFGSGQQEIHYYNLALAYIRKGALQEGIAELQEAISLNSDYVNAHYQLGLAFYVLGRIDQAETELKTAVTLDAFRADIHNDLGNIYDVQAKKVLAISEYEKSLQLNRSNTEALYNIARLNDQLSKKIAAIRYYSEFVAAASDEYRSEKLIALERIRLLDHETFTK